MGFQRLQPMFEATRNEVDSRYDGAIRLFNAVCTARNHANLQRMKGLAFVEMYAIYEFSIRSGVRNALTAVKIANMDIAEMSAGLQGLILDPDIMSCSETSRKNRWKSRSLLFARLQSGTSADLNVDLFPDDGSHYRRPQIQTLWDIFGIRVSLVPDGRLFPLIGEIVEHRNAVAHGRERPEDVGRVYTTGEIRRKFGQSKRLCRHILAAVERRISEIIPAGS